MSHKLGDSMEFSSLLSAAAGGPVIATLSYSAYPLVFIEFIAPDNHVKTHSKDLESNGYVDVEKEVFF